MRGEMNMYSTDKEFWLWLWGIAIVVLCAMGYAINSDSKIATFKHTPKVIANKAEEMTRDYKEKSSDSDLKDKIALYNSTNERYKDYRSTKLESAEDNLPAGRKIFISDSTVTKIKKKAPTYNESLIEQFSQDTVQYLKDESPKDYDLQLLKKAKQIIQQGDKNSNELSNNEQTITLKEMDALEYYRSNLRTYQAIQSDKLTKQDKINISAIITKLQNFSTHKYTKLNNELLAYQQLILPSNTQTVGGN